MKHTLILLLVVVLLCAQSCTIEKRHYRSGFYVNGLLKREKPEQEKANETALEISEVLSAPELPISSAEPELPNVTEGENPAAVEATTGTEFIPATNDGDQVSSESVTTETAPKIEQDKDQAIGAGVAAALFFLLGMTGLIIKGTAGPAGVFIGAAFVCFVLCVILASLLYPRDPVVKPPKEQESKIDKATLQIGLGLMIAAILGILVLAFLVLQIFIGLF